LATTSQKIAKIRVSEQGQEGLNAFLQKRRANWIKE
jgi:methylglutaconyl-CoA hydratase